MATRSAHARRLLSRVFFIGTWLPSVRVDTLRRDVVAGLTVGVLLIPQSMAYALLAGLPPLYGLYASLVPLLVYPFFGTSRHLSVGITAIDSLVVAAGVSALAAVSNDGYVGAVLVLTAQVGLFQVALGLLRLGAVVNLLSRPVIAGFTAAAALTIAASQLPALLGLEADGPSPIWEVARRALDGGVHGLSLALSVGGVLLLLGLKRWAPRIPSPLLLTVGAGALVAGLSWDTQGLAVVGAIDAGWPPLGVPVVSWELVQSLLPTAATLALLQFMSVTTLGKVFGARHGYSIHPNREIFAIGLTNLAGSLCSSAPVSGSFSRTALSDEAGGQTPLVNVVAAGLVGLTLLVLTPYVRFIPLPVLASLIVVSVFGLIDVHELRTLFRINRIEGALALGTLVATLVVGIQGGLLLGIGASVVLLLYQSGYPNAVELGHLPGTRSFRDLTRYAEAHRVPGILILRIDASFAFTNAEFLKDYLLQRSADKEHVQAVVLDASSINTLDSTAAAALLFVAEVLRERGVDLYFGGVKTLVLDTMYKSGLIEAVGPSHFLLSPHRAVEKILAARRETLSPHGPPSTSSASLSEAPPDAPDDAPSSADRPA
ncbi:MAG: sulfate permease [Bacteroidota bacterium]